MTNRIKYFIIFFSYLTFFAFQVLFEGPGYSDWMFLTITFVVFTYAIFLAFSISNRKERITNLRENLRESDAILLSVYSYSKIISTDLSEKIKKDIDAYITKQLDLRLVDFEKSEKEFFSLYDTVSGITTKSDEDKDIKLAMLAKMDELYTHRKKVEFLLGDRMQGYEWLSVLLLSAVTLFCLFYINEQTTASYVILPIVETVIIILIITIMDLDRLKWQEQNWIWKPISSLLIALDLLPYFPNVIFSNGRLNKRFLKNYDSYRMVDYPNIYPDFSNKEVQIIKNKSN